MKKKLLLLPLALSFSVLSATNLCCSVTVGGRTLDARYSPFALYGGQRAAAAAIEEIASGEADIPAAAARFSLSFTPPEGTPRNLSAALMAGSSDVMLTNGVYVGGQRLGSVASAEALYARLDRFITGQMPNWATRGEFSREVTVRREYTRSGYVATTDDMALLISGAAPVMYFNEDGYMSRA